MDIYIIVSRQAIIHTDARLLQERRETDSRNNP